MMPCVPGARLLIPFANSWPPWLVSSRGQRGHVAASGVRPPVEGAAAAAVHQSSRALALLPLLLLSPLLTALLMVLLTVLLL